MSTVALRLLLAEPEQAGAFFVDERDSRPMVEAAGELGFEVLRIDLGYCRDKACVMRVIGGALRFPDWVGDNWDALADALNDLSWLPADGYLLVLEHAGDWRHHAGSEFAVLPEILNETSRRWAAQGTAFWALLPLTTDDLATLAP